MNASHPLELDRLPRRPQPLHPENSRLRESYGSWLMRLSQANGFADLPRLAPNLGRPSTSDTMYVGRHSTRHFLATCGVTTQVVTSLTLHRRLRLMHPPDGHAQGFRNWVLPNGQHAVCPVCISQDATTCWRQNWRMSTWPYCPWHGVAMVERCKCGAPFQIRVRSRLNLDQCDACGAKIALLSPPAHGRLGVLPDWVLDAGLSSSESCRPLAQLQMWQFWQTVRVILAVVLKPQYAAGVAILAPRVHQQAFAGVRVRGSSALTFESQDAMTRWHCLHIVAWLLEDWPSKCRRVFELTGVQLQKIACCNRCHSDWAFEQFRRWTPMPPGRPAPGCSLKERRAKLAAMGKRRLIASSSALLRPPKP